MLTERQMKILHAIIDAYRRTGEPSGSKHLRDAYDIQASPATIRNEMVKLEDENLITKMHSSSGRVPTEAGYRYYLNYIVPQYGGLIDSDLDAEEQARMSRVFQEPYLEVADLVQRAMEALADLTNFVAIALTPGIEDYHLAGYQLIPLADTQVMTILVTEEGIVENQLLHLPQGVHVEQLEQVIQAINHDLIGLSLPEVLTHLKQDESRYFDQSIRAYIEQGYFMDALVNKMAHHQIVIHGRDRFFRYLLDREGFEQIVRVEHLLNDRQLLTSLVGTPTPGITIRMGDELPDGSLEEMSLVQQTITLAGIQRPIVLAILGPENMSYIRTAQLFQTLRRGFNHYLDDYYQKGGSTSVE
ncbi:MAG: heat-inducible transcriptional repressor HrcA [Aerococcus sp.]|nr:heat-inducible transcriptional repressor HrcA [Aerococcus sp.]